jgi:hypothetical protein
MPVCVCQMPVSDVSLIIQLFQPAADEKNRSVESMIGNEENRGLVALVFFIYYRYELVLSIDLQL